MTDPRPLLTLAHSEDADDVFMWWPITGKLDPSRPGTAITPPVIDTGRFRFQSVPGDIQAFNQRAIDTGDLDITAVSMHCYTHIARRYALTRCGWSVGDDWGPKLVVPNHSSLTTADLRGQSIAVPGLQTTAFMVASLMLGPGTFEPIVVPFAQIIPAVLEGRAAAGVLIHERQLDFQRQGLRALADLGVWWKSHSGLPLPLGANVVRRDLDTRFGPGTMQEVSATLRRSIQHALAHRAEGLTYAARFAGGLAPEDLDRYIEIYVSPITVDCGSRGLEAVRTLLSRAAAAGLCPDPGTIDAV